MTDEAVQTLGASLLGPLAATLAVVRAALSSDLVPMRPRTRYVREHDSQTGQTSLRQEPLGEAPDFGSLMLGMFSVLEKLPQVDRLLAELDAHPELADLVFVDAGGNPLAEDSRKWWVDQFVLIPFVQHLLALRPDAIWDDEAFEEVFADLVRHLERESIPVELIAPLENFESDLGQVKVDQATRIAALDDELAAELLERFGGAGGLGFQHVSAADLLNWSHLIRFETIERHPMAGPPEPARPVIPDLVTALRLLRESGVRAPFVYRRPLRRTFVAASWGLSHGLTGSWFPFGTNLDFAADDVPVVVALHRRLGEIEHGNDEAKRRFELAVGRINTSAERVSTEDRLIDYWIALETLFVPDSRGEISFRARTRVARFVTADLAERKQISETLSRSYDRRSKIVHGDKPRADTPTLTNETGELLRRALRKMLEEGEAVDLGELDLG
jgi:hypothetical protein